MSQAEFQAKYLTYIPSANGRRPLPASAERERRELATVPNPTQGLVDWSTSLTSAVKDQGYCGSCWAFSAIEQVEADVKRVLGQSLVLSTQQAVSCTTASFGCGGGNPVDVYAYLASGGGAEELESAYPYTSGLSGRTGRCLADKSLGKVVVANYYQIAAADAPTTEAAMAAYVQSTGPLSIAVAASNWNTYTGGILTVCPGPINHAVQAVGVDVQNGYWKIRNSWGSWGQGGYILLSYNQNLCGLTALATYTTPALYTPPSPSPSSPPVLRTSAPTVSAPPTITPVATPTRAPINQPTKRPSPQPVPSPTNAPTSTGVPSPPPSKRPTSPPVVSPTPSPNSRRDNDRRDNDRRDNDRRDNDRDGDRGNDRGRGGGLRA